MAEDNRQQPVAIRVTRPYGTAEEFLERELETLTRTSVTLIGAQERPKGVILRFEVMLAGGTQLLRGEGRVVGYKESAHLDQPGLVLRFTRLDTKSKALVDRAAAMREARARAALQAAMGEDSLPPHGASSHAPPSFPPSSIGPMSVATTPSSRAPIPASSDRAPGMSFETPRFERPTSSRPQSSGSAAAPSSGNAFSFDDNTFSASDEAPITTANPRPTSSKPSVPPPPPPSSPTVADDRFAAQVKPPSQPRLPEPQPEPRAPAPLPVRASTPADINREPLLQRLRDRAKNLSSDRLSALARR